MLSILKFSGSHWSRAAVAWIVFAFAVEGLAEAGAETAEAKVAAYNAAVALGVLDVAERSRDANLQVAKIDIVDLDLDRLDPGQFADHDQDEPTAPR